MGRRGSVGIDLRGAKGGVAYMADVIETKAQRAERLKKSHDEHVKNNPAIYQRTTRRRPSSQRPLSGPGWAQNLVNSLGRLEVSVKLLEVQSRLLESLFRKLYPLGSDAGDRSALRPEGEERDGPAARAASRYLENLRFDLEDSEGDFDNDDE